MRTQFIAGILASVLAVGAFAGPLDEGIEAVRRKDYFNAVRLLMPLAQAGDAEAQLHIGELYYHGHGVKESDVEALRWFSRAAAQGVAEAQFRTANMYVYGLGVAPDEPAADRKAAQWYFAAARQGHAEAQYGLAVLFLTGKGVERSDSEALEWMRRAADQGHADARRFVRAYTPAR